MNILITTPYPVWPVNSGSAARTSNIGLSLAKLGHEVTLLSPASGHVDCSIDFNCVSYRSTGLFGHFWNRDFKKKLKEVLIPKVDLVVMAYPYQSFMVIPVAYSLGIPVVYDAHNVEKDRFFSMGKRTISYIVGLAENYLCLRANGILSVSEEEMKVFHMRYNTPVKLLPNGVDLDKFVPEKENNHLLAKYDLFDKQIVLYFGSYDYPPNEEALRYLIDEVWPNVSNKVEGAVLMVVGKNPPSWIKPAENIIVTGMVASVVEYIQLSKIVAVPLFSGGGTRLKIIEALACGKTVLSTEFGAAGIPMNSGDGLVLTTKMNFSDELVGLLKSNLAPVNHSAREIAIKFGWSQMIAKINWAELVRDGHDRK